MTFQPTDHFLPDYHHWGDVSTRLEEALTVPIRRVPHVRQWVGDKPFHVFGCSWHHLDDHGALTQEKFNRDLDGAILDLARGLNRFEEFLAYPITHQPPTTHGRAHHDWIGGAYPFDLRAIIDYDTHIQRPGAGTELCSGLRFHLMTLISSESRKPGDTVCVPLGRA